MLPYYSPILENQGEVEGFLHAAFSMLVPPQDGDPLQHLTDISNCQPEKVYLMFIQINAFHMFSSTVLYI